MIELKNVRRDVASRELFSDITFRVHGGGVTAIIGRNGEGKSTLLRIVAGLDSDYEGDRLVSRGETIAFAAQESEAGEHELAGDYIKHRLPEYTSLSETIDNGEKLLSGSHADIDRYSEAIERFTALNYFSVESDIERIVAGVGLSEDLLKRPYRSLSGGQQKLIDLVMIMVSPATVLLFDEPTNHMDAAAKANFVEWLKKQKATIVIVTHDRDVLNAVDVIYELKDRRLHEYPGNYQAYLHQNRVSTSTSIHQFEVDSRTLDNLKKQLVEAERKKLKSKSHPNPFIPLIARLKKELQKVEAEHEKPSAWIDAKSVADLKPDERKRYEKYKSKNISLHGKHESSRGSGSLLMQAEDVRVGYDQPLFQPVSFRLARGERVRLLGRNGVGKTSLIHALIAHASDGSSPVKLLDGTIQTAQKLHVVEYKQHGDEEFIGNTLYGAVENLIRASGKPVSDMTIRRTLAQYMFDPMADAEKQFTVLSGGEKARLSLMRLLLQSPDVMILDEPTNHLDLPSIEELEKMLHGYDGAVLYVSHDSYFADELAGEPVELVAADVQSS